MVGPNARRSFRCGYAIRPAHCPSVYCAAMPRKGIKVLFKLPLQRPNGHPSQASEAAQVFGSCEGDYYDTARCDLQAAEFFKAPVRRIGRTWRASACAEACQVGNGSPDSLKTGVNIAVERGRVSRCASNTPSKTCPHQLCGPLNAAVRVKWRECRHDFARGR